MLSVNILNLGIDLWNCYPLHMLLFLILSHFSWSQDPLLQGHWIQNCEQSSIREEVITADTATLREHSFMDSDCRLPYLTFESSGALKASEGKMEFTFKKVSIRVHDSATLEDFKRRQVCRSELWQQGVAHEITGLQCQFFPGWTTLTAPRKGDMRYGIYLIEKKKEGDRLYLGRLTKDHDALSPETRPQQLDPRYYIRGKQPHGP